MRPCVSVYIMQIPFFVRCHLHGMPREWRPVKTAPLHLLLQLLPWQLHGSSYHPLPRRQGWLAVSRLQSVPELQVNPALVGIFFKFSTFRIGCTAYNQVSYAITFQLFRNNSNNLTLQKIKKRPKNYLKKTTTFYCNNKAELFGTLGSNRWRKLYFLTTLFHQINSPSTSLIQILESPEFVSSQTFWNVKLSTAQNLSLPELSGQSSFQPFFYLFIQFLFSSQTIYILMFFLLRKFQDKPFRLSIFAFLVFHK